MSKTDPDSLSLCPFFGGESYVKYKIGGKKYLKCNIMIISKEIIWRFIFIFQLCVPSTDQLLHFTQRHDIIVQ
jgi:hypothetical protein